MKFERAEGKYRPRSLSPKGALGVLFGKFSTRPDRVERIENFHFFRGEEHAMY